MKQHPELQVGEVFIGNCNYEYFAEIGWASKRRGKVAYDVNGNIIEGYFPVFIQRSEVEYTGQDPDKLFQ